MRTLQGHTGSITSVAYSPSGNGLASGGDDRMVRLWNAKTGALIYTLLGAGRIRSMAYSPNGSQLAAGGDDKTVRVWNAQTGNTLLMLSWLLNAWTINPMRTLRGHTHDVTSLAYAPSGNQLASGSDDRTVRQWNAKTGVHMRTLRGHTQLITGVAYSPNGYQLASGSNDCTVRIWDVDSGDCLVVMNDFHESVRSVSWKQTSSGTYLVTSCADHSVRTWQIIEKGGSYQAQLCWSSSHDRLNVTNTLVQDTKGLSQVNTQLLEQRGGTTQP